MCSCGLLSASGCQTRKDLTKYVNRGVCVCGLHPGSTVQWSEGLGHAAGAGEGQHGRAAAHTACGVVPVARGLAPVRKQHWSYIAAFSVFVDWSQLL